MTNFNAKPHKMLKRGWIGIVKNVSITIKKLLTQLT